MNYIKSWIPKKPIKLYGLGTSTFDCFERLTGEEAELKRYKFPVYQKQVSFWCFESENYCLYQAQLCSGMLRLVLVTREEAENRGI